jgi:hypothetical protein
VQCLSYLRARILLLERIGDAVGNCQSAFPVAHLHSNRRQTDRELALQDAIGIRGEGHRSLSGKLRRTNGNSEFGRAPSQLIE